MSNPEDDLKARELEGLRAQVAALTARVHTLELKAGIKPQLITPAAAPVSTNASDATVGSAPPPPRTPQFPSIASSQILGTSRDSADLEGTIGRLWFNRVGIFALLFGVAFFLKYAFENNWIGPSVRVVLGLLGVLPSSSGASGSATGEARSFPIP